MSIVRDNCDERQIRVHRMIDEFRRAQSRLAKARTVKGDDQVVELQRDAQAEAAGRRVRCYTDFTREPE